MSSAVLPNLCAAAQKLRRESGRSVPRPNVGNQ